jgi:hypothetical protein
VECLHVVAENGGLTPKYGFLAEIFGVSPLGFLVSPLGFLVFRISSLPLKSLAREANGYNKFPLTYQIVFGVIFVPTHA